MSELAIALSSAFIGASAAGGFSVVLELWDRRTRRRVAAMIVLGDISVAEAAFGLLVERRAWFDHDFDLALSTWVEHRADFAAAVEIGSGQRSMASTATLLGAPRSLVRGSRLLTQISELQNR
jgi:hypothetical protein